MISKEIIQKFITTGDEIIKKELHKCIPGSGMIYPDYISGPIYDKWMNDIKLFVERNLTTYPLYDEMVNCYNRRNSHSTSHYNKMMSYLQTILDDNELYQETLPEISSNTVNNCENPKHLFISHSSLDIEYVEPFVRFLSNIGFIGTDYIFCSSVSGYGIPMGKNIYEYLKQTMNEDTFVIVMLSNNYYASVASLNEMGAAWVRSLEQCAILLPGFEYSQISGSIDASKVWMRLTEKDRLNELRNRLFTYFNIPTIDESVWEKTRNLFIEEISQIANKNKFKSLEQNVELEAIVEADEHTIKCVFRFNNNSLNRVACSKLKLSLTDTNDMKSSITLNYSELSSYVIYGKEHRRITIKIPKDKFDNYNSFDFNSYGKWSINSYWTTCIE